MFARCRCLEYHKGGPACGEMPYDLAVGTAGYYTQKHPYARNANTISIELCCKCDGDSTSADDPKWYLTESSKSPASIARSNKQWVGTCLYQEWYKPLLISCEAATRL